MVGRTVLYKGEKYRITEWDWPTGKIATEPANVDLKSLLKIVMIGNFPFIYYPNSDVYGIYHPHEAPLTPE
jgi:hypothetical protein